MNKFNVINKAKFSDLEMIEIGGFAVTQAGVIFQRVGTLGWLRWVLK